MEKNPTLWGVIAALVGTGVQGLGVTGPVVGGVVLVIAFGFALYAIRLPVQDLFSTTVPIKKAAMAFYEEARKSKSYWALAAERMPEEKTPAARLNYCCHALKTGELKWSGVHAPSSIREDLDPKLVDGCSFLNDSLDVLTPDGSIYTSVRVSKSGLRALLEKVRGTGM